MKKKDAFYELLKFYLANDVYAFEQKQGDPVLFCTISSDHCPLGYKGIEAYIKETELRRQEMSVTKGKKIHYIHDVQGENEVLIPVIEDEEEDED